MDELQIKAVFLGSEECTLTLYTKNTYLDVIWQIGMNTEIHWFLLILDFLGSSWGQKIIFLCGGNGV